MGAGRHSFSQYSLFTPPGLNLLLSLGVLYNLPSCGSVNSGSFENPIKPMTLKLKLPI